GTTGKSVLFRRIVSSHATKNILLYRNIDQAHNCPVPCPRRDVSRSSRYVGRRMRWTLRRQVFFTGRKRPQRTAKSCGPDAATVASSRWSISRRRRWQETPLTGESTYKP